MSKSRMEAFSDGVLAIIITIMVLELEVPHGTGLDALVALAPALGGYVLSFAYIGIYWNNHHHLLQSVKHVDGRVLWANLHLLFWLSLLPFATRWVGKDLLAPLPAAVYGVVLLFAAVAYYLLTHALIARHGADSVLATAVGRDFKGKVSVAIYLVAAALAFASAPVALALYTVVAVIWMVPDRRIERRLAG
jgi:uncharacterized membrane protein